MRRAPLANDCGRIADQRSPRPASGRHLIGTRRGVPTTEYDLHLVRSADPRRDAERYRLAREAVRSRRAARAEAAARSAGDTEEAVAADEDRARLPLTGPASRALTSARSFGLTSREHDVLRLVAEGRTNRQIAEELFISPKTASVHVSNILGKLGVSGRGEAAAVAHRAGLFVNGPGDRAGAR